MNLTATGTETKTGRPDRAKSAATFREGLRNNYKAAWGRAYVRVIGVNRELSWVLLDIFLPLFSIAAYVYLYRSMGAPRAYDGFVILGALMTAYWLNVLWSMAAQFYWEREIGHLELYMLAPISPMAILFGMSFGGIFQTTVRAAVTVTMGSLIFGVRFQVADWAGVVGVFLLTLVSLYGLGMAAASLYLVYGRNAWNLSNLFQEPVYLLSGVNFPVKALGFWVAAASCLIPLTLGMDALRQLSFGDPSIGFLPVRWEVLGLTVIGLLTLVGAWAALKWLEDLAKRQGRLTLKWQ
ncbi:MAG TPA: ABC transporter permease [Bacillota bacterium]|jgi:ABC-2 type transport system permease protein